MKFDTTQMSSLSRSNGLAAYSAIIKEINESTIPTLENFSKLLADDSVLQKAGADINRVLGLNARAIWPTEILGVLKKHVEKENSFEDLISEVVPKDLQIEALDSRSAQIAQYIDNLFFFSEMTRKLITVEVEAAGVRKGYTMSSVLSVHETKEIRKSFTQWVSVFGQLKATASVKFNEKILAMPEFAVGKIDAEMIHATYGKNGGSPIAQGFFSAEWNPIFAIRAIFNRRLIKRYHVAKEERQNLEYRIQALTESKTGEYDPRLEKIIEFHTGELKRLNLELSRIEEKAR